MFNHEISKTHEKFRSQASKISISQHQSLGSSIHSANCGGGFRRLRSFAMALYASLHNKRRELRVMMRWDACLELRSLGEVATLQNLSDFV